MKRLTIALLAPLFIASAQVSYADLPNDISAAGIPSYSGTWLRADDAEMPGEYQIKIKKINDTEFNVELTKPRVQNRYSYNDDGKITYITKNFTAIFKDGVLHIDNGGMEVTTLTYNAQNQSIQTTKSWSFPNGVFTQSGDEPIQTASQIPAYKAKKLIEEGLMLGSVAKPALAEYYAYYNKYPENNEQAGLSSAEQIKSEGVKSVAIAPSGKVIISYTEAINPQAPPTITLQMSVDEERGLMTWTCSAQNISENLVPKECAKPVKPAKAPQHKIKEYIAEGLNLASSAKVATAEYYANYGKFPQNNYEAGLANAQDIWGRGVKSVAIEPEGKIIIRFKEEVNPQEPATITLTTTDPKDTGAFVWKCSSENIPQNVLPEECKAQ